MRALLAALLLLPVVVSIHACKAREGPHRNLARIWRDFEKLPDARALAVAGDPERIWVAGAVGGLPSPIDAEEKALEQCQRKRMARRLQAPCRLYATGSEIVWEKY